MKHNKRMTAAMLAAMLSLNGAGAFAMQTSAAETETNEYAVTDAVALHKFLMGKGKLSKDHHKKMDMTGDGVIDAFDLALMKRRLIEQRKPAQKVENAQLRMESTRAVTEYGWYDAFEDEALVFTSPADLEWCGGVKAPVLRHLQKTYTAEFFEENILCVKIMPVTDKQDLNVDIDAITVGDTIEIPYSIADTAKDGDMVTIAELTLPKKYYKEQEIVWKQKNAKPVTVEYYTESLYGKNVDLTNAEALISTQGEMVKFLSSTINADSIAEFKLRYPASFFEEKSLHMTFAYDNAPRYELAKAVKCGDTISISLMKEGEYGMASGFYQQTISVAEINKSDLEGAQLEMNVYDGVCDPVYKNAERYGAFYGSYNLYVQYVDYADETDVEMLMNPYECRMIHGIERLWRVPMQEGGYRPIQGTPSLSEDFKINWSDKGACVQLKTSPDAENFEKLYITSCRYHFNYEGEYICEKHEQLDCDTCFFEEEEE